MKTFTQIFENSTTSDPLTFDVELIPDEFIRHPDYIQSVTITKNKKGLITLFTIYTIIPKKETEIQNTKKTIQLTYSLIREDTMNGSNISNTKFNFEAKDNKGNVKKATVVYQDQLEELEKLLINFNTPQPQPQQKLFLSQEDYDEKNNTCVVTTFINNGNKIIKSVKAQKNGLLTVYTIIPSIQRINQGINQDMLYRLYKNESKDSTNGYRFTSDVITNGIIPPIKSISELENGTIELPTKVGEELENVLRKVGNIEDEDIVDANTTVNPDNVFNEVKYNELLNLLRDYWTDFSNATSAYDEPAQED